jgi:UDP-N-acetylmuramate dehydrogenase
VEVVSGFSDMKNCELDFSFFTGDILYDEPLQPYNTFGIGGQAQILLKPRTAEDIVNAIHLCKITTMPYVIIGYGSNILFPDEEYSGVVIDTKSYFHEMEEKNSLVYAQAGVSMQKAILWFLQKRFTGFAFMAGIPGSIGGCITMNAGTNRGRIDQILHSVTYFNGNTIQKVHYPALKEFFSYRTSLFLKNKWSVLSAEFILDKGDVEKEKKQLQIYLQKRNISQPLHSKSAGCFWKNPPNQSTGKILQDLGLKGYQRGNIKISEIHANFVINTGNGTCKEVLDFAHEIEEIVLHETNIQLEREVQQVKV